MKTVFVFSVFILLFGVQGITNLNHESNLITEDERRGAEVDGKPKEDLKESQSHKRGIFLTSGSHSHGSSYPPSSFGVSGLGGSGHEHHHFSSGGGGSGYPFGPHHSTGHGGSYGHYGHGGSSYGPGSSFGSSGFGTSGHGGGQYGGHSVGGHGYGGNHGLALKGLLIPLAGIALLGAAAALSTNPVLLQLGVVNGRRRRSLLQNENVYPPNPHLIANTSR